MPMKKRRRITRNEIIELAPGFHFVVSRIPPQFDKRQLRRIHRRNVLAAVGHLDVDARPITNDDGILTYPTKETIMGG